MPNIRVVVNRDLCNGCAACEGAVPEIFELGPDGIACVLVEEVPPELEIFVQQAADDCPEQAITVE
jgi:ferredoxin